MNRIPILLIFIFIIICFNNYEGFTNYTKCDKKPVSGIIKQIFQKNNITKSEKASMADLYLPCGYNNVENELKGINFNKNQKIFGISGCDGIVSKRSLWNKIKLMYGRKEASKMMPESYIFTNNNDIQLFKNEYDKTKIYILKKPLQRKKGILISNNYNEIINAPKDNYKLVQRFIDSYKINDRKMNLRIYVLIICREDIVEFYVHELGKCLYAPKKTFNNNTNFEEQITDSYKTDLSVYNTNPKTQRDFYNYLNNINYGSGDNLYKNIINLFKNVAKAIGTDLCNLKNIKKNTKFQLFGADILVDNSLHPYLLEMNKGPDMTAKDEDDRLLKTKVQEDMFSLINIIQTQNNGFRKIYQL